MKFDAFVDALYRAGWNSPNDAQHTEIKKLWTDIFPSTADAENDIEDCCSEIRRLNLEIHELKLNKQTEGGV